VLISPSQLFMLTQITETSTINSRKCLICSSSITLCHFGMDCCRACAMFFKRTKLSGMKYACGSCDRKCGDEKTKCRRCRFARCLAVGLSYDGPLRVNRKPAELSQLFPMPRKITKQKIPSFDQDTLSVNANPSKIERILERIGRAFNASEDRRRIQENRILGDCNDCMIIPHPTQKIYLANHKNFVRAFNVCCIETRVFFREAFPSIAELKQQEQDMLFKGYINMFNMIESHFRTREVWGELKRYLMGSVMICFDLEGTDRWLEDEEGGENRQSLLEAMLSYANSQFTLLLPMLNKSQLTKHELYAVLALILCEKATCSNSPEHIMCVLDKIREKVIADLELHYKQDMGLDGISTRLGNLMTLTHAIFECDSLFQVFFRLQTTVFDL
ncbi:hypothetical protein PENTCL1PPCAC_24073, partial [Pristionchus entomophagus]